MSRSSDRKRKSDGSRSGKGHGICDEFETTMAAVSGFSAEQHASGGGRPCAPWSRWRGLTRRDHRLCIMRACCMHATMRYDTIGMILRSSFNKWPQEESVPIQDHAADDEEVVAHRICFWQGSWSWSWSWLFPCPTSVGAETGRTQAAQRCPFDNPPSE